MPSKLGLGLSQIVLVRLGNLVVDMGKEIYADGHRSRLYSPENQKLYARVESLASFNPAMVKTPRRPARRASFVEHSLLYHQSDCIRCLLHFVSKPSMRFERSGRDLQGQR